MDQRLGYPSPKKDLGPETGVSSERTWDQRLGYPRKDLGSEAGHPPEMREVKIFEVARFAKIRLWMKNLNVFHQSSKR